jgi:hypothetical protein
MWWSSSGVHILFPENEKIGFILLSYVNNISRSYSFHWTKASFTLTQVIDPSPEPAGMTSFLAVSLPPDSCPDKTGEFLSVPIGSRKFRLETDWKMTGIVRKHPTGIRRQRTSQKLLGNGRKRPKPAGSDTEIARTVPASWGSGNWIDRPGEITFFSDYQEFVG